MDAYAYARQYLFEPLGIRHAAWSPSPEGHSMGHVGLYLTSRDMAKFGLCRLNGDDGKAPHSSRNHGLSKPSLRRSKVIPPLEITDFSGGPAFRTGLPSRLHTAMEDSKSTFFPNWIRLSYLLPTARSAAGRTHDLCWSAIFLMT